MDSYFTMTIYRYIGEVSAFSARLLKRVHKQYVGAECNVSRFECKTK